MTQQERMDLVDGGMATVKQAVEFTGKGTSTLYYLMDRGRLVYGKYGSRRMIPWNALRQLVIKRGWGRHDQPIG